ncbi:MAG TPA: class I SAM-dependent methyltransferase [Acidimicrobiales bacterium]|nr:class I SAM-dependent methyltransferase [Acidimicrobiales bacterium]
MKPRRVFRAGLWGLAVVHVAETVVLRRRARALQPLSPELGPASPSAAADPDRARPVIAAVAGATVDEATLDGAAQVMTSGDVAAVDLVPARLSAGRALRLLRRVDPGQLRADPFQAPGGAHEAVALHTDLARRMEAAADAAEPGVAGRQARGDLVRLTRAAQRHAPAATEARVARGLRAPRFTAHDRWVELDELTAFARPYGALAPVLVGAETAHLAAMVAGLALAPLAGVAALATWSAQPALVFGGREDDRPALQPPALAISCVLRVAQAWRDNLATAAAGYRAHRDAPPRPAPLLPPEDELFEPRRTTCPWCGEGPLEPRVDTTDVIQHKPGRFHLDECRACGHVFQNPALSLPGLDHYYAEFYEGDGAETWEVVFAGMGASYAERMDVLARLATPRAWLDVGTGHGHFCLAARQRWPEATFDGLDVSESVDEAQRRGWIDRAHRGPFPDLADGLPRSYDVVSMHHYLEHTREPRRELAAAAKVLEPGGHLVIEEPDVESPWSRRLGRWWRCWFQPQHQHFVTCANLVAALDDQGFDVVSVQRGPAGEGLDVASAVAFWVNGTAPTRASRWLPPPTARRRARRAATVAAAVPLLVVAAAVDLVKDAWARGPGSAAPGNAYRVVARRR